MAIVHIAMFDALNAIERRYHGYTNMDAANLTRIRRRRRCASGSRHVCVALFPSQRADLDEALAQDLAELRDFPRGHVAWKSVSVRPRQFSPCAPTTDQITASRASASNSLPGSGAGLWRPDPSARFRLPSVRGGPRSSLSLCGRLLSSACPRPPALDSADYAAAFDEVKQLGGDGITTPTVRSETQSQIGIFWAYDGMPSLCAPPRLYNQIALQIAEAQATKPLELARLLSARQHRDGRGRNRDLGVEVLLSVLAPGYRHSRSEHISASDRGSEFHPLGAPASNLTGPNFTPPFPAYPSGHAGFGGALFQVLREFYGTDRIPFRFVSDEFNGQPKTTRATCAPESRAISDVSPRRKKKTDKVGSTWEFTGVSTRPRASHRGGASPGSS